MINRAVIMGRLTATPELKTTQSGLSVLSFTVAVERPYRSGQETQTDFINCVAWRKTAEFIDSYFHKGQMIAIDGTIQTRIYEDRNGQKRTTTEIIASNVSFCGGKTEEKISNSEEKNSNSEEKNSQTFENFEANSNEIYYSSDDELPF